MKAWLCDHCGLALRKGDPRRDDWRCFGVCRGSYGEEDYQGKVYHACPEHTSEVKQMRDEVAALWEGQTEDRKTAALARAISLIAERAALASRGLQSDGPRCAKGDDNGA